MKKAIADAADQETRAIEEQYLRNRDFLPEAIKMLHGLNIQKVSDFNGGSWKDGWETVSIGITSDKRKKALEDIIQVMLSKYNLTLK